MGTQFNPQQSSNNPLVPRRSRVSAVCCSTFPVCLTVPRGQHVPGVKGSAHPTGCLCPLASWDYNSTCQRLHAHRGGLLQQEDRDHNQPRTEVHGAESRSVPCMEPLAALSQWGLGQRQLQPRGMCGTCKVPPTRTLSPKRASVCSCCWVGPPRRG